MISEVVMPQMGADMVEGTLLRWIKHEGDRVERGEIIAEIETDKANVEIEAFESGVFRKTLAAEGDVVPVGGVIAIIAGAGDDISQYADATTADAAALPVSSAVPVPTPAAAGTTAKTPATSEPAPAMATPGATSVGRVRVSPVARHLAEERGIDVRSLHGSGPDGRIIRRDVEAELSAGGAGTTRAAAARSTQQPAATNFAAMSKMRQAIARRMAQSKREAPHYYLLADVDMTDAFSIRTQLNETLAADAHASINDLIVRACAMALQAFPEMNVTVAGDQITRQDAQHICIAIALDDGLIAPAIVDAGHKTLIELAAAAKDLVARAKGGRLRPDEMNNGTFTITNLGAYGIEALIGIIQPPQTAILGVGTVADQPAVRDGAIVVRKTMKVALSADHRITDGAYGAQFLAEIKRLIEHPLLLIM